MSEKSQISARGQKKWSSGNWKVEGKSWEGERWLEGFSNFVDELTHVPKSFSSSACIEQTQRNKGKTLIIGIQY